MPSFQHSGYAIQVAITIRSAWPLRKDLLLLSDFLPREPGNDCDARSRDLAVFDMKIARRHLYEYVLQDLREFAEGNTVAN